MQWVKTIERMKAEGVTDVVECGPGKVLVGLVRRIAPEMNLHSINDQASLDALIQKLA